VPFRDPARARFSSLKTHGHYTCLFLPPSPSLKSISSPHAQTSRIDPPIKHPLNYLASHNSLAIICRRRVSLKPPVPLLATPLPATPLPAIFRNENPGIKRLRKRPGTRINMPRKRPKQGSRNEDPGTKRLKTRASTP
jgi:hypothetical protein